MRELSSRLQSKVTVGSIDYGLFDVISINDLYVEDLNRDTLLHVGKTNAHFSFWKLFRGKIKVTSVEFDHLYGNLVVDSAGHSNLDFVIDAFKKPEKKEPSEVEYMIDRLKIKNSSFNYSNYKQIRQIPEGVFNGNKMKLSRINADISLDLLDNDSLSARINSLNAVEQTGLVVTDVNSRIMGSRKGVRIPYFDLHLPNSLLQFGDISLRYDSLADLKHFTDKVRWNAPINTSEIALSDLSAFVPEFKNMKGKATIKGLISGRISSLRFQQMEIKYGKTFEMNADLDINGLPRIGDAFIYGQINKLSIGKNDLQDFISDISRKPFVLPKELNRLGIVKYTGNITGFLSNLVAYGNLTTNLGSISTDILLQLENNFKELKYNGTIKSKSFQLGKLVDNKQLGKVAFNVNTKGFKKENTPVQGTVKATVPELQFNNYAYRDIRFNGKYDGNGFDGKVDVEDENINAHFNGVIDMTRKLPVFVFDLTVKNTNLNALKLTDKYPGALLSFTGKTNMVGNSLDNINGYVEFDSINFTNRNKTLSVDKIQFMSRIGANDTRFLITSDFVNGTLSGNFKYSNIVPTVNRIISSYLPAFANGTSREEKYPDHIDVDLKIANTEDISDVFELPYKIQGVSTVKGYIDVRTNRVDLTGDIPLVQFGKRQVENISMRINNPKKQLQLTTRAQVEEKGGNVSFYLLASASNDSVATQLGWQNTNRITNAGEIQTSTLFSKQNGRIAANISIFPTQVIIADSVWDIHRSRIEFHTDSSIYVRDFRFDNEKQFVHINGKASHNQQDSMMLRMNDINLDFLLNNVLSLKGIQIGGHATGSVALRNLLVQPIYEANLFVKDVMLNKKLIGNANLYSTWDNENSHVLANGIFTNNQKDTLALADGVYVPKNDSLDFMIRARKISIEFLTPYLETVLQDIKGTASGDVRMFGPSKILGFEGDILTKNVQVSLGILNTTYFLSDSVHLTRKSIEFRNATIYDQERNPGTVSGLLTHNGIFKEMEYNMNLRGRNLLAMNTTAEHNDYFFGKAYANGTVRIFGDEKEANIVVNAVSQPNTKCFVQMGGASKASDNSFINFVSKTKKEAEPVQTAAASNFNVKVNLQVEVTPEADMELIVDPKGGDMITARGSGNLRVEFDSFSDIKLFGTYMINNGYYLFTMQNVIRKEFKIDQGSSISWTGSPFNAQVDIRALYPLSVSLKDLAGSQLGDKDNMRATVPVNCVLELSDNLMKPDIKFDLELPQSDESVKQLVRNIVNTDEMMTRQILYLLVFNKFYTPDYMRTGNSNTNFASNEGLSFFTSTVSAQLNNWLKQAFNNVTVGIDYQQSGEVDGGEYQAQILYQPNNRIVVNGNLGYRNDNLSSSTNRFIGDVDFEYLLNESGKLRFKAYNHTVDRYYYQGTSKLSQGVGFIYKEDFNSMDDLFKYYWGLIGGNKKKTQNGANE